MGKQAIARQALIDGAISSIYDAMIAYVKRTDELSGWEWMMVFTEVQKHFYQLELEREWRDRRP